MQVSQVQMAPPRAPLPAGVAPVQQQAATRTVLIADDEQVIVELLALLLEDEGFAVLRAYDGEDAWRTLCARPADLVISDISMPRLDGLALLHRLRTTPLRGLPVILMSAHDRDVAEANVTFVTKPFDLERMVKLVREALPPNPN